MNELENLVKNVVYGGIGAAAALVEKGGDLARSLVEKGQETVRANQGTVDQIRETAEDLKRRVRQFCDKLLNDDVIDASCLTPEQRAAMRQQLDEQDELDRQAKAACTYDEPQAPADAEADVPSIVLPDDGASAEMPEEPAPAKEIPTIQVMEEEAPAAPVSDDDVPVFEPDAPTYTAPDEE